MKSLIDDARNRHVPTLSLSVEPDNPELNLYRSLLFEQVGEVDGSATC